MPSKKRTTKVIIIIDESGSMGTIWEPTMSAFNEYLDGLEKETPKSEKVLVTLGKFTTDHEHKLKLDTLYHDLPIKDAPRLSRDNYRPLATTPLYDAIGKMVQDVELAKNERALVVIQTDGYENSSREWTKDSISKLVSDKTDDGNWTFVYLGAGIDAMVEGMEVGVPVHNTLSYAPSASGNLAMAAGLTGSTRSYMKSAASASASFFPSEDDKKTDKKETVELKKGWKPSPKKNG